MFLTGYLCGITFTEVRREHGEGYSKLRVYTSYFPLRKGYMYFEIYPLYI